MKNLLNDPDVLALYKGLQNNKYEDIDDYLTSFSETTTNSEHGGIPKHLISKIGLKEPDKKIFWGREEVNFNFEDSDDYGL